MRTLYDSTSAVDIPTGSQLVLGYVDGSFTWNDADWNRFPGRTVVRACIHNDRLDAQVIDIEEGNNDAKGAVPWVKAKWAANQTPTVYCYSDSGTPGYRISDVRSACDAAGVKRPLFLIAQWDGDPTSFNPKGDKEIIGKQYAGSAQTGGHYDASVVADYWPGVDALTIPAQTVAPALFSQSNDQTVKVGEVAQFSAGWTYVDGSTHFRIIKKYAHKPGRYIVRVSPLTEDLTTEHADAETFWLLTVMPSA